METTNGLGELIREARLRKGWTQEELASRLGVKDSYISQWETGGRKWPRDHVRAIARVLGLSQVELAVAAGLIDRPEVMPPRPAYQDERLRLLAERWDELSDPEKEMILVVLDRHLLRAGEPGIEHMARTVARHGDVAEAVR